MVRIQSEADETSVLYFAGPFRIPPHRRTTVQSSLKLRYLVVNLPMSAGVSSVSEWTSEWPNNYVTIHGCSGP